MAKPRIFVSSTYYDLKHIRTSLESFIHSFGYEPVLFESGDIFFSHEKPLDESCFAELQNCHMQILIIGGSYGSAESGTKLSEEDKLDPYRVYNSVTRTEFQVAHKRQIPIYFFVENSVLAEYNTYKKNRENTSIVYAHVSSVNIFALLDEIYALQNGNYIQGFTKFEDISSWLKAQWAHLMAEFLSNRTSQLELRTLSNSLESLSLITSSLKDYSAAILNKVEPGKAQEIETDQKQKFEKKLDVFKASEFYSSRLYELIRSYEPVVPESELLRKFIESISFEEFAASVLTPNRFDEVIETSGPLMRRKFMELKRHMEKTKLDIFPPVFKVPGNP